MVNVRRAESKALRGFPFGILMIPAMTGVRRHACDEFCDAVSMGETAAFAW